MGDDRGEDQASSILRQYREVVGAVLQRNKSSMVLRAVGELESGIQTLSHTDASGGGHLKIPRS